VQPLAELADARLVAVRAVLTDIDDTLSTAGRIGAEAYSAMQALHDAGLLLVPVTGRPAGWCDHIARMWPVDAVVGENGAFYMLHDAAAGRLRRVFRLSEAERRDHRARLAAVAERVLREVPGCALASDQAYREADVAIDFCEDVPPLPRAEVDRIVALMRDAGLTVKVSSIHVNGWIGDYDKLAMTRELFAREFGIDLDAGREDVVFVGDSPNDSPMFAHFPLSVGVANVARMADRTPELPKYVTERECGPGFAELARRILGARRR
jgi:hypothetical protein